MFVSHVVHIIYCLKLFNLQMQLTNMVIDMYYRIDLLHILYYGDYVKYVEYVEYVKYVCRLCKVLYGFEGCKIWHQLKLQITAQCAHIHCYSLKLLHVNVYSF